MATLKVRILTFRRVADRRSGARCGLAGRSSGWFGRKRATKAAVVAQHLQGGDGFGLESHELAAIRLTHVPGDHQVTTFPTVRPLHRLRRRRWLVGWANTTRLRHFRSNRGSTAQQLQNRLLAGVGLGQHRRGGLLHDLRLGQLGRGRGVICVFDLAARSRHVHRHIGQVVNHVV